MPISTFGGLNIAFSGVQGASRQLNTTGQNIANASTVGYSRQESNMTSVGTPQSGIYGDPLAAPGGVDLLSYRRIRDVLLDRRYYDQAPKQGQAEAQAEYLSQIESFFSEPTDTAGMRGLMDKMFTAFQEASNTPTSTASRQSIINSAATLASAFNDASTQLNLVAGQVADELTIRGSEINQMASQIEDLTQEIRLSIAHGGFPNDLHDQRDVLIDKLAQLGNITVAKQDNGNIDVTFGGFALVTAGAANAATAADLAGTTSGRYAGLLDLQSTSLPQVQTSLDDLASAIITQVNAQHALGSDLSGAAGGAFFSGTTAATMTVAISNPNALALSSDGSPGNAGNALALNKVRDLPNTVNATLSISGAYQQTIANIGSSVRRAEQTIAVQQRLTDSILDARDSVSGVSMDEEMANLIRFQTAYGGAARAVTAMDEMLETLVSRTGKVGL